MYIKRSYGIIVNETKMTQKLASVGNRMTFKNGQNQYCTNSYKTPRKDKCKTIHTTKCNVQNTERKP